MASANREERWQAKRSTVLERNKYMFNNPLLSDIKFSFNIPNAATTLIPAHKYVLAVSSPVFFTMFYGDLAETRDTIDITDCDPDIFLHFLHFIYCDQVNFEDLDCAINVWYLADKYDVPSLSRECVMFIDGNMDQESVFDVIPYARQFNDQSLEMACWEVIDRNAETIVDDKPFLDIEHEILLSFVERSSLHIEEIRLFNAVDRWATKRCEKQNLADDGTNKRFVLGEDLLKKIRFCLMLPSQFTDVVLSKDILTKDEVTEVFQKSLSSDNSEIPREISVPRYTYRIPSGSIYPRTSEQLSTMLTFKASKPVLLCGLNFLFHYTATHGYLSISLRKRGVKIKQLAAKSHADSWSIGSCYGENMVFFNRPISVDAETCYTLELLGASSRSTVFYATNRSSGMTQRALNPSRSTTVSATDVKFRFCGGLFKHDIPENPYFGLISEILFQDLPGCHFRAPFSPELEEELSTDQEYDLNYEGS